MSVSTHVLDAVLGRPAAGMVVQLLVGDELLAEGVTDADGRFRLADRDTGPDWWVVAGAVIMPLIAWRAWRMRGRAAA